MYEVGDAVGVIGFGVEPILDEDGLAWILPWRRATFIPGTIEADRGDGWYDVRTDRYGLLTLDRAALRAAGGDSDIDVC